MIGQLVLKHLINGARNSLASRGRRFLSIFLPAVILTALLGTPSYATPTWTQTDFSTGATGTLSIASGTYTIAGAGSGIATSGTTDSFSFVSTPAAGNTEIVAQVSSQTNTSPYAVAGLMVRDSLAANGAGAVIGVSPSNGINFTSRLTDGATSNTTLGPSIAAPVYLRLVRSGTSLAGYQSSDGINWTLVGSCTITLPSTYYIGFAVSSNVYGTLSTAVYNNVTYMTSVPQRNANLQLWLRSDVGITYSGGNVSAWADQSGNGNNAAQSSGTYKPTLTTGAINGLPAVSFNSSSSQNLQFGSGFSNFTSGASIFVVAKPTTTSPTNLFYAAGASNADLFGMGTSSTQATFYAYNNTTGGTVSSNSGSVSTSQYQFIEGVHNGAGTVTFYVNGTQQGTGSVQNLRNVARTSNYLAGPSVYLSGQVAEILVLNAPLSSSQRESIENYIYSKYGLGSQATLDAPTITPGVGVFSTTQTVTLTQDLGQPIYYTTNGTTPTTSSTPYTGPFTVSTSTTVKAISAGPNYTTSAVASAYIQIDATTANVPRSGMLLWLKGDNSVSTSGSSVTQWTDVSGNGNSASQSNSSYQPVFVSNAVNSLPAISFNGSSQFLQMPSGFANLTAGATVFMVTQPTSSSATGTSLCFYNSGPADQLTVQTVGSQAYFYVQNNTTTSSINTSTGALAINQYQLLEALQNGASAANIYVNGTQQASGTVQNFRNVTRTLNFVGSANSFNYYPGAIAEILVYNTGLTTTQRAAVEAYLINRYALGTAPTLDAPSISPAAGVFTSAQFVTLTQDAGQPIYYTTDGTTPTTSSTLYTAPFTVSFTTTVKAISAASSYTTSSVASALIQIDPTTSGVPRSGLMLWLKSDNGVSTSGSNVTQWLDLSGNGNTCAQGTGADQPTFTSNAVNGLPTVNSNGSTQTLQFAAGFANFTSGASMFALAKPTSSSATGSIFSTYVPGGPNDWLALQTVGTNVSVSAYNASTPGVLTTINNPLTLNQYQLIEAVHNGAGSATIYVNGTQSATGAVQNLRNITRTYNSIESALTVNFYPGSISEMLVYNRPVTSSERANIESYFSTRYQTVLQTPLAPIISVAGGTLSGPTQVAITAQNGCTIYVTQDGTTPTTSSPQYSGPINVYYSETVKAIAVNSAGISSSVSSASYTLNSGQWPAPASGGPSLQINLQQPTNAVPQ